MKEQKPKAIGLYVLAFVLPVAMMIGVFILKGVYPFGDRTILSIDMDQQYIDFYSAFRRMVLEDPGSFWYSMETSIGGEMTGLWSYYLTSPLNLLYVLVPAAHLNRAVAAVMLLKYGLSGLTMAVFLRRVFSANQVFGLLFSISYALMGYMVLYQMNTMWIDAVVLLPLVMLGLERIIEGRSGWIFFITLAMTLFSNYYIGYMVVLFTALYLVARLTEQQVFSKGRSSWFPIICTYAVSGILAAGVGAIIYLPTVYSLLHSKGGYAGGGWLVGPLFEWSDILSSLTLNGAVHPDIMVTLPMMFVGSLVLIFVALFFVTGDAPRRARWVWGILTLFLFLSTYIGTLDKIWHLGQHPAGFPARFSFMVCFVLIELAYRASQSFKGFSAKQLLIGLSVVGLFYGMVWITQSDDSLMVLSFILSVALTSCIVVLLYRKPYAKSWGGMLLLGVVFIELFLHATLMHLSIPSRSDEGFEYARMAVQEPVDEILEDDESWFRIEKNFSRSRNDSLQAGYNGVSHFSSSLDSRIPDLFSAFGLASANSTTTYANSTLLTDAIFGVKYYLIDEYLNPELAEEQGVALAERPDVGHTLWMPDQFKLDAHEYSFVRRSDDSIQTRHNPYALSLGVLYDKDVLDDEIMVGSPIDVQNNVFNGLKNMPDTDTLYTPVPYEMELSNATFTVDEHGRQVLNAVDTSKDAVVDIRFESISDQAYYMNVASSSPVNQSDNVLLKFVLNGEQIPVTYLFGDDQLFNVSASDDDGPVHLQLVLQDEDEILFDDLGFYALDMKQFERVIADAKRRDMVVTDYSSTSITGEVTIMDDSEMLILSLPHSEGWTVLANGESVTTRPVMNGLLGVELAPGQYSLELSYVPPWVVPGTVVSIVSVLAVVGLAIRRKQQPKRAQ